MNKKIIVIIKVSLGLLVTGQIFLCMACGKQAEIPIDEEKAHTEKTDEREKEDMVITAEYLQREFGISEEELEGINLEEFLAYYHFTIDNIQGENLSFWLQKYKDRINGKAAVYYTNVLKDKTIVKLTEDNEEEMIRFIWERAHGEEGEFIVIDFETGNGFIGEGLPDCLTGEDVTGAADNALKEQLLDCFRQYDITSWWELPVHEQAGDELHESWSIVIELTNDRACKLWGEKLIGGDTPENLVPFIEEVEALVGSSNP